MWIRIRVQDFKLNKHKSNILQFLSLHAISVAVAGHVAMEMEMEVGMADPVEL